MVSGAVSQGQIDQVLIGHPEIGGKLFEIDDGRLVQPHGYALLEVLDAGVAFAPPPLLSGTVSFDPPTFLIRHRSRSCHTALMYAVPPAFVHQGFAGIVCSRAKIAATRERLE